MCDKLTQHLRKEKYKFLDACDLDFKKDMYNIEWTAQFLNSIKPMFVLYAFMIIIDTTSYLIDEKS